MANRFYMIWRENGQHPSKAHGTIDEACAEARRLSEKHPNTDFYVLESKVMYRGDITVSSFTCTDSKDGSK